MLSSLITMTLIAVASNLDNAGVGIAYGVRSIRISSLPNALIALISGIATFTAGIVGHTVTRYVSVKDATWIGAAVMMLVGLWVLSEPWRSRRKKPTDGNVMSRILRNPEEADFDKSESISMTEASVLGVALAMNALAGGFDAGVVQIGILFTSVLVSIFSFVLLGFSAYLGRRYAARAIGDKATYIAGLLLLAIGFHQIW